MMKKYIVLLLSLLVLQNCTFAFGTKDTMNKIMNSWIGENINSVIAIWGYPTSEKTVAGRKLYTWSQGSTIGENIWGTALVEQQTCNRILEVDESNNVKSWQWEGVSCPDLYCTGKKWVNPNNNPWKKK